MQKQSSNKTIAQNTIFLYFRMMFTMVVSLYTSRVNLSVLGVMDNGIYEVVGGVVVMFSFLNGSLSGATSRFLTYDLGKGDIEHLKKTFSSALNIHIVVAIIILILAETIGLWFFENKLVIPANRMHAASIVYQLSILASMVSITQVPYSASLISHEHMGVFAYMSILEVSLKLLICYLLYITPFDKLITFAILVLIVNILIQSIYRYYCTKHFEECHFKLINDKAIIKPILSFSAWDLFGNFSVMARGQGVNMVMNMFFGPIINSAAGFSTKIGSAVYGFANNFLTAIRPPIVKAYAIGDYRHMEELMINASKYSFALLLLLSAPFVFESKFILVLWLKTPPPYTDIFCVLELMLSLFSTLFLPLMFVIHATGRIRRMSIINGSIWFMSLPITYVLLKLGYSPTVPYVTKMFLLVFVVISNILTTKHNVPAFRVKNYLRKAILPSFVVGIISLSLTYIIYMLTKDKGNWANFLLTCTTSTVIISLLTFYVLMNRQSRQKIFASIKNKFLR